MDTGNENIEEQTHTSKSMELELPNPNRSSNVSKVNVNREEGELSSSDNEENPVSSASQSPGIVNQPLSAGYTRLSQSVKFMQGARADGMTSGNKSASFVNVHPQTSVQPSDDKSFQKNQGTFKSRNRGWSAPSDVNNNLVIRFSDDDSDSDSDFEKQKQQKALESKQKKSMFSGSRKPPLIQSAKPSMQRNVRSTAKVTSRKMPMSRAFMPSTTKKNGGINLGGPGMSLVNQGSQVRNVNNVNKSVSYQQHGIEGVGACTSKLQDLRQQIAFRERELKLRASQQYREIVSVPGSNYKAIYPYSDASKRPVPLSANIGQAEHKEPEWKRLKSSGTYSSQLKINGQEKPATKTEMPSKTHQTVVERNMLDSSQKGSDKRLESGIVEHVDISQNNPPIGLQGAAVHGARSKSEKSGMQTDPHVVVHETAPQVNTCSPCNLEKTSAYPGNINLWNFFCPANFEQSDMDSLTEMEEALDKELDEAQETRRRCEIEERKAFKAYWKAQRALIEANSSCAELYHRRELCSARFHSMITGAPSMSWSSRQLETGGTQYPAYTGSGALDLVPTSSHCQQPDYDHCSLPVTGLNIPWGGAGKKTSYQQGNGHILGSEPCSEPDASTSDPLPFRSTRDAANAASSPNDPNMLIEEDGEASSMDLQRMHSGLKDQWKRQDGDAKHKPYQLPKTDSQDSLALEASLRSQLFSRLGVRTLSKNNSSCNVEPAVESSPENGGSEKTQASNDCLPFTEVEKNQERNLGGHCEHERSDCGSPVRVQKSQKSPSDSHCAVDNGHHLGDVELTISVSRSPSSVLRSAFDHMKVMSENTSFAIQSDKTNQDESFDQNEDDGCINTREHFTSLISNSVTKNIRDICGGETGSFICAYSVDPFWPLCMYELRGKCNNDECPWQHFRDFCNGNVCQRQLDDCQTTLTLNAHGETNHSKGLNMLSPPTYLVGLDVLKVDEHSCKPVVGRKAGQCWDKCFSICLVLSSLLQKGLSPDESLLHGHDGRIEVIGDWNRQSSCIQSTKRLSTLVSNASAKNIPPLEMALLTLTQEVIKLKGKKEVLAILAQAVETDPTSEILWIVYLLIYYHDGKTVQDDDMFFHAVRKTKGSYGLWLLYINSRLHLDSRLHAYDDAIADLCLKATASSTDKQHSSACILDLFLQMMNCLCISGNVERAIQKISAFFTATTNSDEPHSSLLSDILACLTIPDTYMFWICCIYLVIYRKLPYAVVEQFEREKEILAIEWPTAHIQYDEKDGVVNLVERIIDSVELCVCGESSESEANLKSEQHFAVSHIRLMVALHGTQCYQNILDKYIKLYPSSLELVLLSARHQAHDEKGSRFVGFEETLANWPQNIPGIHCIWNQYVECALQKGHIDLAKEIVSRWSSSKTQYSQDEMFGVRNDDSTCGSLGVAAASFSLHADKIDTIFRDLNLCLSKILQNDHVESRLAIDRALNASAAPFFKHCLREHATFVAMYDLQLKRGDFGKEHFKVLGSYLKTIQALPASQPLSRHFIKEIEKPRIQQVINNILSPVSTDFHLLNTILEAWYGPSLLPQNVSQPKELVDFVEAILEMVPSNYQLAISVCKLLSRGKSTDVPSCSMLYWASSTLVNALFHAVPIAPEYAWVEAAGILGNTSGIELISETFYKRALSVYPFSIRLWNCHYNQSKVREGSAILEAAQKRGIILR